MFQFYTFDEYMFCILSGSSLVDSYLMTLVSGNWFAVLHGQNRAKACKIELALFL